DRKKLRADGRDLSFITVAVADKRGLTVPRTHPSIRFSVEGPGEIVGVDNGDPTSHEAFQASERKAFNGLALVIVRTLPGKTGNITLRAESEGLQPGKVVLLAR
ncbi:MAG TPA: hypothetical protein VGP93_20825, partial [Polyangiaceae bacterium]|nr:hypothetical protein [Polyangiaceae bacterium]